MCRVTGIVDFNIDVKYNLKEVACRMRDTMVYGGPDDEGIFLSQTSDYHIALGHRRLSIIDVSENGHQPMFSADNSIAIVFNGEIYNYREIREELLKQGCSFKTESDTEVLIEAYRIWGIKCVNHFNGMFAFLLFDKNAEVLYAVRDREGVKPLYYYRKENTILFGSELKAFHKHPHFQKEINTDVLGRYFQFGYISAPDTIFKNAFKVYPGHYLAVDLRRKTIHDTAYWNAMQVYDKPALKNISYSEVLKETENILKSSCNYKMVADVPVGIFLSGGYDSTLVTSLLQKERTDKIKTFSIGFSEEKFNEADYARKVASYLGTEHIEYYCTPQDVRDIIPTLPEIYDEPFADSSAIPTILVSQIARQSVKVALSADGGDEIFGGYDRYAAVIKLKERINRVPQVLAKNAGRVFQLFNPEWISGSSLNNSFFKRAANFSKVLAANTMGEILFWLSSAYTEKQVSGIFGFRPKFPHQSFSALSSHDDINTMLAQEFVTYLPDDILTKIDRATMSVSIEGRVPLLDHRLVEWMAQIPGEMKIKNGVGKYILKDIVHKYIPKEFVDRPKMGFGINLKAGFRNELKDILEDYLSERELRQSNLFRVDRVRRILDMYYNGDDSVFQLIWCLLMFQMWYRRWMENEDHAGHFRRNEHKEAVKI